MPHIVSYGLIVGAVVLVYAITLGNELVFDDATLIPHHDALRNPFDLGAIFTGRYWGGLYRFDTLYRPLVIWSLALNAGLNGALGLAFDAPPLYHAVNTALHAGVSVLLYQASLRLNLPRRGALAAGLLFAVHPIHTEAVASIVNRSELFSALFGLAFLILHLEGRRSLAALSCFLLALFSKESAVTWLPLVVWIDLASGRRAWRGYALYALAPLVWGGLRAVAVHGEWQDIPFIDNPLVGASEGTRLLTALHVQFDYLQLQLVPVGLSSDYSAHQIPLVRNLLDPKAVGFVLITIGLAAVAWRLRQRLPLLGLALGGYAISMSVASNLVLPIGTIMGERLAYAPSLFFCLLAGLAWKGVRPPWAYLGLIVILAFGGLACRRNLEWRNSKSFYLAQVRSAPSSAKAHYAVARSVYAAAGDLESARQHYLIATQILPDYADAWNNLGSTRKDLGDLRAAMIAYERAVSIDPHHPQANANLGVLRQQQGDLEGARRAYERSLESSPDQPQTLNNLAMIYIVQHRPERARPLLQRALRLAPDYALARQNLGRIEHSHR